MADEDKKDFFIINKDSFEKDFRKLYEEHFHPTSLIQFAFVLPFRLPANGLHFTTFPDKDIAHTFVFAQLGTIEEIPEGVLGSGQVRLPMGRTRVEMAFISARQIVWDDEKEEEGVALMQRTFDYLLEGLNVVLTAYILATSDATAQRVTQEMIGPLYFGRFVSLDNWEDARLGGYMNPKEPLIPARDALSAQEIQRWKEYFDRLGSEPLLLAKELDLSAARYGRQGLYPEAVIYAQVSVEVLVHLLYANLCSAEGKNVPPEIPFISIIKKEMPRRLGGNWNLNNERFPVGKWYKRTYELRNRIVHAGYNPTREETAEALNDAEEFREWLVSRATEKRKKYPKLASYLQDTI